jgi:D-alanine transaminase
LFFNVLKRRSFIFKSSCRQKSCKEKPHKDETIMKGWAYSGGRYCQITDARVSILDRGYLFGDGVYELIPIIKGKLANLDLHLARLGRSCEAIELALPYPLPVLTFILTKLAALNKIIEGSLYLQITRGGGRREFKFPTPAKQAVLSAWCEAKKLLLPVTPINSFVAHTVPDIRWQRRDIKSIALLAQVLAKEQASKQGGQEAVMVDIDGTITEGASSNFWIVRADGVIQTRPLTGQRILPGVTRHLLLELLAQQGQFKVEERPFTVAEAKMAKEAFVTAARLFVWPVTRLEDVLYNNGQVGPVTQALRTLYCLAISQ